MLNKLIFGDEFAENFKVEKEVKLQYRRIIFGTYKGNPAVAKLFSYRDIESGDEASADKNEIQNFAYRTITNAANGLQFAILLKNYNISLNVPELFYRELSDSYSVLISQWCKGKPVTYKTLTVEDIEEIVPYFVRWRNPQISNVIKIQPPDLLRWYIHDHESLSAQLESTLIQGYHSNSWTTQKITPVQKFLQDQGLSGLLDAVNILRSLKFKTLIDSYNNLPILQHADTMCGYPQRDHKLIIRDGNIIKLGNNFTFLDLDFASIQSNALIGLCFDAVKFYLYLWNRDDVDNLFRSRIFKEFRRLKLEKEIDIELSWHTALYIHTLLWELPFFIRIFDKNITKDETALDSYQRLLAKLKESGEYLLSYKD